MKLSRCWAGDGEEAAMSVLEYPARYPYLDLTLGQHREGVEDISESRGRRRKIERGSLRMTDTLFLAPNCIEDALQVQGQAPG